MSLSDLKKKKELKPKAVLSVDEFIEDAAAYAKGKSIIGTADSDSRHHHRNFKNATFTLGFENIAQLTLLSEKTGLAKSRIVRLLIENQFHHDLSDLLDLDRKS